MSEERSSEGWVSVETLLADEIESLETEDPVGQLVHKHATIRWMRNHGMTEEVIGRLLAVEPKDLPEDKDLVD